MCVYVCVREWVVKEDSKGILAFFSPLSAVTGVLKRSMTLTSPPLSKCLVRADVRVEPSTKRESRHKICRIEIKKYDQRRAE